MNDKILSFVGILLIGLIAIAAADLRGQRCNPASSGDMVCAYYGKLYREDIPVTLPNQGCFDSLRLSKRWTFCRSGPCDFKNMTCDSDYAN